MSFQRTESSDDFFSTIGSNHLTFFFLSTTVYFWSYLIWQIISFIFPPNEYDCVHAWTKRVCDWLTEDADFGKKSSFQMKPILIFAGMQTNKIVGFGA